MARHYLLGVVAVLLVLLLGAAIIWLIGQGPLTTNSTKGPQVATNLALDVRYTFDAGLLSVVPYDHTAEYPLRLDAEGFSFYAKRIKGAGKMLSKGPGAMLYDLVGVEHLDGIRDGHGLKYDGEPIYEDVTFNGKLGLSQSARFVRGEQGRWPRFFPEGFQEESTWDSAAVHGWALFTDDDLFYFLAVGQESLSEIELAACEGVINSMEFGAVVGSPVTDGSILETEGGATDGEEENTEE